MTQHTKTPWRVQATYPVLVEGQMADGMWALVADAGGDVDMPQAEWASNAAFIVKAVNAYDGLVAALREVATLTARQQLPLTAQIHALVTDALESETPA